MDISRIDGPMSFRFILQPCTAAFLAVRAGRRDVREGKPPYLFSVLHDAEHRRYLLHDGWKDVSKAFILGVTVDAIWQLAFSHRLAIVQALTVASLLALLPYALVRGAAGRFFRTRS